MKNIIYFSFALLLPFVSFAQVGIGTASPEGALDIKSTTNGLLIVRTSLTSATDVTTIINPNGGSLVESTMVYNDGVSGLKPAGFYYWNGLSWAAMSSNTAGDVKYGFQTGDHDGWYLLDGRAVSTLTTSVQGTAATIGFTTNLPDARNKFVKGKGSAESLASTVGSNSVTLTQANLPNFNMSATTNSAGNHSHTGITSADGAHTHNYDNTTGTGQSLLNILGVTLLTPTVVQKATSSSGVHSHTLDIADAGFHTHTITVNSGGSGTAISTVPSSVVANTFVYLGR